MATISRVYQRGILNYIDTESSERCAVVAPCQFYDDFIGAGQVIPTSAEKGVPWIKATTQTAGSPAVALVADSNAGIMRLSVDATSEEQGAVLYAGDQRNWDMSQGFVFEARVRFDDLPTDEGTPAVDAVAVWGMAGDYNKDPDSIALSAWFAARGDGAILCELDDDGVTDSSVSSGTTVVADVWHTYRIENATSGYLHFYIDGVRVSYQAWAPGTPATEDILQPIFQLYKASDAAIATMDVDYVRLWMARS